MKRNGTTSKGTTRWRCKQCGASSVKRRNDITNAAVFTQFIEHCTTAISLVYLGVAVIAAGFVALLVVVALAVGLVTHPIRTLALVFHKLAALSAGLALILALIAWFWTDHTKPDFVPCFWGSIGVIVASILIRAFAEWILERPTRAERRAMKRAAAQETGRVTMRMPVSKEVAAAFESTRDGRRASL